jgi:hypothetical protein
MTGQGVLNSRVVDPILSRSTPGVFKIFLNKARKIPVVKRSVNVCIASQCHNVYLELPHNTCHVEFTKEEISPESRPDAKDAVTMTGRRTRLAARWHGENDMVKNQFTPRSLLHLAFMRPM